MTNGAGLLHQSNSFRRQVVAKPRQAVKPLWRQVQVACEGAVRELWPAIKPARVAAVAAPERSQLVRRQIAPRLALDVGIVGPLAARPRPPLVRRDPKVALPQKGLHWLPGEARRQATLHDYKVAILAPVVPLVPAIANAYAQVCPVGVTLVLVEKHLELSSWVVRVEERSELQSLRLRHRSDQHLQLVMGVCGRQDEKDPLAAPPEQLHDGGAVPDAAIGHI
mmetsp:Transcript_48044/g.134136  ORF Transcript_48044/g.134136 Transcript_48044/m.134136 type:complete len:223 (+) Transcript_48044:225-893(+)